MASNRKPSGIYGHVFKGGFGLFDHPAKSGLMVREKGGTQNGGGGEEGILKEPNKSLHDVWQHRFQRIET